MYERKKNSGKKGAGNTKGGWGNRTRLQKKKEKVSSRVRPGGLRGLLCGDWRVTGVPMEGPAMTVPPDNAGYAGGVALMDLEKGCSCLPWRSDIVQLDKAS